LIISTVFFERAGGDDLNAARWPALAAARLQTRARVPLCIDAGQVGSVAAEHLEALRRWPRWIETQLGVVNLVMPAAARSEALASINETLRSQGLIVAWRDEPFALWSAAGDAELAVIERAAARFWGTLTRGAHCTGFVRSSDGGVSEIWIARRALHKATDPGKLDNLVGGGVPRGQTPQQALVREGFEEAGLDATAMRRAAAASVIEVRCDIAEGFMHEHLHSFDLELPRGVIPRNQDGEVASFECVPAQDAARLAAGDEMTVDAALVTLDFLLRHGLLPAGDRQHVAAPLAQLVARRTPA
jgi:8-oxo-dGTP pyrophosphatase MutT (NUDIX family)